MPFALIRVAAGSGIEIFGVGEDEPGGGEVFLEIVSVTVPPTSGRTTLLYLDMNPEVPSSLLLQILVALEPFSTPPFGISRLKSLGPPSEAGPKLVVFVP